MSVAVFLFLATASIAFFGFLVAHHWLDTRAVERRTRERFALLRKLADQPAESVQRLVDLVREDDAREAEREAREREQERIEELKGGVILIVVGICLAIFLGALTAEKALWTVGLIPGGVGVIVSAFAYFKGNPRREA